MHLTTKEQHLVHISAATAVGNLDTLKEHLVAALDDGLNISEIKELLVQLYAYCGFPRSLNGLVTFMMIVEGRKAAGIQDEAGPEPQAIPTDKSRFELGDAIQQQLVGGPVRGPIFDFAPAIDAFLKEHLFADIFLRGVLPHQEREIITIAALSCINVVSQLNSHIRIGMNTGLTTKQIESIADTLKQSGYAEAADAIQTILSSN